ncbi:MAG: hypothetical protein ACRDN9_14375 [Streptosporangiaceae bacterium]
MTTPRELGRAGRFRHARVAVPAESARLAWTGRWINRCVWTVAIVVMVFSAGTVYQLLRGHGVPPAMAWMLAPAVDLALCAALIGDRALHRHGVRVGWGTTLRWTSALTTLSLNIAGPATQPRGPDIGGVLIHAVAPVLLIVLTEASQAYQLAFAHLTTATRPDTGLLESSTAHTGTSTSPTQSVPARRSRPAHSGRPHTADRERVAAALTDEIRHDPDWRPDYPALMARTGMSRSWCEKRVVEARRRVRAAEPSPPRALALRVIPPPTDDKGETT